jgi:hypothetical protein
MMTTSMSSVASTDTRDLVQFFCLTEVGLLKFVMAMKAMEEEYDPVVIDMSNGLMLPNLSY